MLAHELFSFVPLQEKPDGKKYIFECQHGEQECLGNMIEVKVQRKYTRGDATEWESEHSF